MDYPIFICGRIRHMLLESNCHAVNMHSLDDIHCMEMRSRNHLGLEELPEAQYLITSRKCPLYKEATP